MRFDSGIIRVWPSFSVELVEHKVYTLIASAPITYCQMIVVIMVDVNNKKGPYLQIVGSCTISTNVQPVHQSWARRHKRSGMRISETPIALAIEFSFRFFHILYFQLFLVYLEI